MERTFLFPCAQDLSTGFSSDELNLSHLNCYIKFALHFNIILPTAPNFPSSLFTLSFTTIRFTCFFFISYILHA